MICSLCSLLCDHPALHTSCALRNRELSRRDATPREFHAKADGTAKEIVRRASTIHFAGRLQSVETCRAAIDVARAYRATIDGSHPASMFDVAQAIAGSGAYLCSLAEARSISDCLIVIHSAELLERFPQLPAILNRHFFDSVTSADSRATVPSATGSERSGAPKSPACVLLLGPDSPGQAARWQEHFSNVIAHNCAFEAIPSMLLDIKKPIEESVELSSKISQPATAGWREIIANSHYPVVVWGSAALPVPAIDFWLERLQSWFLQWNEHSRASGLSLSSLAHVFHHTSTWLTGYPSRLDFTMGELRWERHEASTARWLEKNRHNESACLVWIDESDTDGGAVIGDFEPADRFRVVELSVSNPGSNSDASLPEDGLARRLRVSIGRPGVDYPATLLRSDQIVMSYPSGDPALQTEGVPSAASWLRGLLD